MTRRWILSAALALLLDQPLAAQTDLGLAPADGPLEIAADEGIEWLRDEQVYIARGNATARQGDTVLRAAELKAHYRAAEGGGAGDIYKVEAIGGVTIETPEQRVTGAYGYYDIPQGVMVLRGDNLQLETPTDTVTARDSLEYWTQKRLAVARGAAEVVRRDPETGQQSRIRADIMTAAFEAGAEGANQAKIMEAFDNVEIFTRCEYVRADYGRYLVPEQIAQVTGNVKITRGETQLNGDEAEVNLATGISTLKGERVRGLIGQDAKDGGDCQ